MSKKVKDEKTSEEKVSRRRFLKTAAATAGVTAATVGVPAFMKYASAAPIKWKIQSAWNAGDTAYVCFTNFCKLIGELSEGKLIAEPFPAGAIVGTFEMFDAVKAGVFDAYHSFDVYWVGKIPACAFLSSYPFGMDRPDQWETWYRELGGMQIAREGYGAHNLMYIGPIQHDDNLIHSKVPIRSFEEFKGKKIRYPGGMIADIYRAAGVSTVLLPSAEVYPALEKGVIDASDYVGAAVNYSLGFGEIAKYIVMGPPSTPCLHQPVDLMSLEVNMGRWKALSKPLQQIVEAAVYQHSWDQYAFIQKADLKAFDDFQTKQGVTVIRLKDSDIEKFKKFAPELWVTWAKKNPLAFKAWKSQWEFMKSIKMGYYTDADLIDLKGKRITL
jgi:TRAP-type mannitol/chloroaromatic compound transport system substrate-binding protein